MKRFDQIMEEIAGTLDNNAIPTINDKPYQKSQDYTPNSNTPAKKRNENDQGKIAGKYFKGMDNTSGKMVSDRDKEKNTRKGSMKRTLEQSRSGYSKVMSQDAFDKLLNNSGGRSLNFGDDGGWKMLNSKTAQYQAKKLSNGKIRLRTVRVKENQSNSESE
jgi:hypothetical protein